jgi:hypothetical protein
MSDAALANWVFERDGLDWIGRCTVNGRRTALKGSLRAAEQDAAAGRVVCRLWPGCPHRDPDACTRAIQAARRQRRAA